jgi:hypothetical protein
MKNLFYMAIGPLCGTIFGLLMFGMIYLIAPGMSLDTKVLIAGMIGFIYGFMMFATITVPPTRPRNDGWRKWRPLAWFAAVFTFFAWVAPISTFGDFAAALFMAGLPTLCGWGMLQLRVERYDFLNRPERANA